jgi:hypothetical protein
VRNKLREQSLFRHPWEINARELAATLRRAYGIKTSDGCATREGRSFVLLIDEEDETTILSLSVLRSLCRFFGIPPEDFGLDPEPEK